MGDTLDKPADGSAAGSAAAKEEGGKDPDFPKINIEIKTASAKNLEFATNNDGSFIRTGDKWVKIAEGQNIVVNHDGIAIKNDKDSEPIVVYKDPPKDVPSNKAIEARKVGSKPTKPAEKMEKKKSEGVLKKTKFADEIETIDEQEKEEKRPEATTSKAVAKPKKTKGVSKVKISQTTITVADTLDAIDMDDVIITKAAPARNISWYYLEPALVDRYYKYPSWVPLDYYDTTTAYSVLEIGCYPGHTHGHSCHHGSYHSHSYSPYCPYRTVSLHNTISRPYSYGYPLQVVGMHGGLTSSYYC